MLSTLYPKFFFSMVRNKHRSLQVIAGSFIANGKKEATQMNTSEPMSAPGKLAGPGGVSQGTMSESSDAPGDPLNQSIGTCNNSNQQCLANITWN